MRLLIYGTLSLFALILGIDTHVGRRLTSSETRVVVDAVASLEECGLISDARMAASILRSGRFRRSRFFDWLNDLSEERGYGFGFYAYTPILSRHRIFVGPNYWPQDTEGRASVTVHELAHLRRHQRRGLRGIPRTADETEAYRYQYGTYSRLHIGPTGRGSDVYWDMMYGIRDYVLPEHPGYAKRKDVAEALSMIERVDY